MDAASARRVAAQVFVDDPGSPDLGADDAHHLSRVLRLEKGELVIAADGRGTSVLCRYVGTGLEPTATAEFVARRTPSITVGFAPVKGDRPEWAVQKLTELGVDAIVPLLSERSVVRWPAERGVRAAERLRRVSREAAAQSRQAWLPELTDPMSLHAFVEDFGAGAVALADPDGDLPTLGTPTIAIGPEGGWGDSERSLGLAMVRLATGVLRAETAAVAAGTLLSGLRSGLVGTVEDESR
ncbi:MAG: RsmE family RNA methyltransferase [Acidimicrobiales bacterium]